MNSLRILPVVIAFCAVASASGIAAPAEPAIGKAVEVGPAITAVGSAGAREVVADGDIFFLDKISTNSAGVGEFVFSDGSKLTVGPSASIVVDKFVAKTKSSYRKLGLNAVKGSFRWISGKSASVAYEIETPQGTLGIRGTTLDFTVDDEGVDVMLISGSARLCRGATCRDMKKTCESVRVRGGNFLETMPVDKAFTGRNMAARVFPFADDPELLSPGFRAGGDRCMRRLGKTKAAFLRGLIMQQRPLKMFSGKLGKKIRTPLKLKRRELFKKLPFP